MKRRASPYNGIFFKQAYHLSQTLFSLYHLYMGFPHIYANSLSGSFHYDDISFIERNFNIRRLSSIPSFLVVLIYGVNPINTKTVNYLSSRSDMMSALAISNYQKAFVTDPMNLEAMRNLRGLMKHDERLKR